MPATMHQPKEEDTPGAHRMGSDSQSGEQLQLPEGKEYIVGALPLVRICSYSTRLQAEALRCMWSLR